MDEIGGINKIIGMKLNCCPGSDGMSSVPLEVPREELTVCGNSNSRQTNAYCNLSFRKSIWFLKLGSLGEGSQVWNSPSRRYHLFHWRIQFDF